MRTNFTPIMLGAMTMFTAPAMANDHGQIVLEPPTSNNVNMVLNDGDSVTYGGAGAAIAVSGSNQLSGTGITVTANGASGLGIQASSGGTISLRDSTVDNQGRGQGAYAQGGGHIDMDGGSITAAAGNGMHASGAGSSITTKNLFITTVGSNGPAPDWVSAVYAENGAAVSLDRGRIQVSGGYANGVRVSGAGTTATLNGTDVAFSAGGSTVLVTEGGQFEMLGGSLTASGSNGLRVADGGGIRLTGVNVLHESYAGGSAGYGISLDDSPGNHNSVTLEAVTLTSSSVALSVQGESSSLSAVNSVVNVPDGLIGLLIGNGAEATLDNTRMSTVGQFDTYGVMGADNYFGISNASSSSPTKVTIRNGSQISATGGAALAIAQSGTYAFSVLDSSIFTRGANGDAKTGTLLRAALPAGQQGQVSLDASNAMLQGDLLADTGSTINVSLKNGSVLTGAVLQRDTGRVNSFALEPGTIWNVRNSSSLVSLNNVGTVAFEAPQNGAGFKTLTVNDYVGGGTLVVNTRLGDDTSPTDKLVIDGGTTSGTTALRIVNAGGAGALTQSGIRVVETANGGTTTIDAFKLDAGSTGYRSSARTLALNGYEYSLVRGGNGGAAPDWYLTSDYSRTPPDPAVVDPAVVVPVSPPAKPASRNVSPESGAYLGNRQASVRFFSFGLHDRTPYYGDSAILADGDGDGADRAGRGLWARVEGRRDNGLRMAEGRVDVDTDSAILQLGGDLVRAPLGRDGAVYAGVMGGYGDARSTSTSTLVLPDGTAVRARAQGKVSGYSMGIYGTAYQNVTTGLGAYVDSWLQFGRYSNQINSELGSARYHSNLWSASVETGYAIKPFADGSALRSVVIEPQAQLIYSRYDAKDTTLQGTRMRSGNGDAWQTRIGVRLYPQASTNASAVRPFLEANWLHSFTEPSVKMGGNTLDVEPSRDAVELKLGAEGKANRAMRLSGHVFGQIGNHDRRGYGGMLNVQYRW